MIVPWIVVFAIVVVLVLVLTRSLLAGPGAAPPQPIDLNALLNLVNADEEAYLRENLSRRDFRTVHRERMLAAVEYAWGVAQYARAITRLAEPALLDSNPAVAAAAERLRDNAVRIRICALRWIPRLLASSVFPLAAPAPGWLVGSYDALRWNSAILAGLKSSEPANAVTA